MLVNVFLKFINHLFSRDRKTEKFYCNVLVKVEDVLFSLHRSVLGLMSQYFNTIFHSNVRCMLIVLCYDYLNYLFPVSTPRVVIPVYNSEPSWWNTDSSIYLKTYSDANCFCAYWQCIIVFFHKYINCFTAG